MVTYQLSVKVQKKVGYIVKQGKKLVVPDMIAIERSTNENSKDVASGQRTTVSNIELDMMNKDLEGYHDAALGTIVFNKTGIPRTECEQYRSVAEIKEGLLFRSKLGDFSIFRYTRENDTVAVTIDQQTRSCGKAMYRAGIQNVHKYYCWKKKRIFEQQTS